jgi:hypothetical protein
MGIVRCLHNGIFWNVLRYLIGSRGLILSYLITVVEHLFIFIIIVNLHMGDMSHGH